jgi:hypothetical protein
VGTDEVTEGPDAAAQQARTERPKTGDTYKIANTDNIISGQAKARSVPQGRDSENITFGTSTPETSFALKAALISAAGAVLAAAIIGLATIIAAGSNKTAPTSASPVPPGTGQVSGSLLGPPTITAGHHPVSDFDEGQPAGDSPCRTEAQPDGSATPFVDQGRVAGAVQIFTSRSCGMAWAEVRNLNSTHFGAILHIDIFRSHTEPASEFSSWTIPNESTNGILPGLMIAVKPGACFYAKVYAGDPQTARVTQTNPICL